MTAKTMEFQAEARQLLDLMIHSLYQNKEIFLRELISNASDALDKVRFEAVTRPELLEGDDRLHIRLETDTEKKELRIIDNGIGMSRDELIENIGTIARSGTREFLKKMSEVRENKESAPELIGQFGVGFYSAFMVADRVTLETRHAGEESASRWQSSGDGTFTIEDCEKDGRGTTITLHLREKGEEGEEFPDLTSEWTLKEIVKRYSDFVGWPIEMDVLKTEGEGDDKKTTTETETLNSMKPLWTRMPSEVTEEEHAEFYKHLTHDWEPPARTIHFRAEGTLEYTALLYVPSHKPPMFVDPQDAASKLSLYVKRVFITGDCEELLPPWLRFVKGLVDSNDLPLNVSRETLQHARQMAPIKKKLVSKVLETFKKNLEDERESYEKIWNTFGATVKEGIYFEEEETRFKIAEICLFQCTGGEKLVSLDEYIEKMPFKQKEIYFLAGADRKTLEKSPHLEALRKNGMEALLLTDAVDEFAMQSLTEFDGKKVTSLEKGDLDLGDDEEKKEREEKEKELESLPTAVKECLGDRVAEVRFSNRLTDSAAVLVTGKDDLSPHLRRMLKASQHELPEASRSLELNPNHPVIQKMETLRSGEKKDMFADYCELLLCQSLLSDGTGVPDPARFNQLVTDLMVSQGEEGK